MATAPNGKLYAIGGTEALDFTTPGGYLAAVDEYDPATNTWAQKPARDPITGPRHRAATAVVNGRVYVIGGQNASGDPIPSVQQYDPATDSWEAKANMAITLMSAAATTAPSGRIHVVGGADVFEAAYATLQEFTPPADGVGPGTWRRDPQIAQPEFQRASRGVALAPSGRIIAAGGHNSGGTGEEEVEEYRPSTNMWRPVQSMPGLPRGGLAFARAGDNKLYAVGGGLNPLESSTLVQRFTPPGGSFDVGSWEGPPLTTNIAQLPQSRTFLGLVGAPNGNLYAIGGYFDTALRHRGEVFEYDPTANTWTMKAPMPTPRRAMSVAMVGDRIFAIGGFNGAPLDIVEEAILDNLPTVGAGGPYTGPAGATVQLNATANDPDGDPLTFAWDMDGDLVYETPGQNPVATVPQKPSGAYPIRVRALDSKGGYAIATATLNIFCGPRPPVNVQTVKLGAGQIRTTITAGQAPLGQLRLGQPRPIVNAIVNVQGGPPNVTSAQDVTVSGTQVIFTVTRRPDVSPTAAVTVPFQVIDACTPALPWSSFVGFGSGV